MRILIALNGILEDKNALKEYIIPEGYDYIIAADGGANHLKSLGITPDEIMGDLDSINEEIIDEYKKNKVVFKKFKAEKNETDSELCLLRAVELNADEVDFVFALGGRLDHELSNIAMLYHARKLGIKPRIISLNEVIYIVKDEVLRINDEIGKTVSVIPVYSDIDSINLRGFKYPLHNYFMEFGKARGVSNIVKGSVAEVDVDGGAVLVIVNRNII